MSLQASMNRSFMPIRRRMPMWRFGIALALLALMPALPAQSPGFDTLDAAFQKAVGEWETPGMAVAVVKDDKVVFAKGYGVREIGKPGAVDADTLFAIASNTKAFTSAAIAMLAGEGKLKLDDPVIAHLPWFQLYDPYVTSQITIRDLMCHRGGLGTFSGDLLWYGTPYSREEIVRRARYLKPAHPFRAGYGYSNLMFIAAGEVVEKASGMSWEEYLREKFFEPLGMKNTVTSVRSLEGGGNTATPHGVSDGTLRTFEWVNWDSMGPAGSIISSANDMSRWLMLQLNRGTMNGRTWFSDASSREMWTPHISFTIGKEAEQDFPSTHFRGYGLGWQLSDYRGRLVVSHGGAYDGMFSRVAMLPEERLGLVVLTNAMTNIASPVMYAIFDAFLGGEGRDWNRFFLERRDKSRDEKRKQREERLGKRIAGTSPSLKLPDYTGTYGGPMYGNATVSLENGGLVLRLQPSPDLVADLTHWHFDTWLIQWREKFSWFGEGTAQFLMDHNAGITEMKLDVPNDDLWFHELEFKKLK